MIIIMTLKDLEIYDFFELITAVVWSMEESEWGFPGQPQWICCMVSKILCMFTQQWRIYTQLFLLDKIM